MIMTSVLKKSVALLLCISMTACTSMHVVADGPLAVKQVGELRTEGLVSGESLQIVCYDGQKQIMEFGRIEAGALLGKVDGKERSIALDQVERIERKQIDGTRTTLLVGAIVAVALALASAAANSMANDIAGKHAGGKK